MSRKKKLALALALAVCVLAAVGATLAYFTARYRTTNVITTGTISITINETELNGDNEEVDYVNPKSGIMPGMTVSKIVRVANTGTAEAWLRAAVQITITGADGNPLPTELTVGGEKKPVVSFTPGKNWELREDGYYYYSDKLAPAAESDPLFESLRFAPEMGNEYQGCSVSVVITSEAVQTKNNDDAEGFPDASEPVTPGESTDDTTGDATDTPDTGDSTGDAADPVPSTPATPENPSDSDSPAQPENPDTPANP